MAANHNRKTESKPKEMVWSCTKNVAPNNPQSSIAMEASFPEKSGEAKGHMGDNDSKRYDWEGTGPS